MLIRLTPQQIVDNWNTLHYCIATTLPPTAEYSEEAMVEVKKKLLSGTMQAWASLQEGSNKIQAVGTTIIVNDVGVSSSNLLIYSLFSVGGVDNFKWKEELQGIKRFAKKSGCKKILGYTNVPRLIELVKNGLGGRVDYQLISLEVE